jgi:cysteinyl-tRNA synthetase
MDALAVRRADAFTYVTEYIPQIIAFVGKLVAQGHAYAVEGDVYFDTTTFPAYGKLSKRNADAMLAGARIDPDERKRDLRDFALWKAAKPGEPWWESPWGPGRPGWHIECSTMAMETLGPQIDIHGGGADLIFPHHENEIAQSEALTGQSPFAKYWLHTGLLQLGDEKMAHSGSFVTIRSVLEAVPAPALRLYLLAQSYRTQFVYLEEQVAATVTRWRRWVEARGAAQQPAQDWSGALMDSPATATLREEFIAALDDDFNTSKATAVIDDLVRRLNDQTARGKAADLTEIGAGLALLDELTGVLGVALDPALDVRRALDAATRAAIEALVAQRTAARAAKNWAESDRIRDELERAYGVVVKDTPQGAVWAVK